ELFSLRVPEGTKFGPRCTLELTVEGGAGRPAKTIRLKCRIDSPVEMEYYRAGGLLPYVLERLVHPPTG
ncbi:MAG: hypothetical protein L3J96_05830, partial [Thermoplasmata archaeon]|nr:hypothetical protein [Thermoplasmata archaeon]